MPTLSSEFIVQVRANILILGGQYHPQTSLNTRQKWAGKILGILPSSNPSVQDIELAYTHRIEAVKSTSSNPNPDAKYGIAVLIQALKIARQMAQEREITLAWTQACTQAQMVFNAAAESGSPADEQQVKILSRQALKACREVQKSLCQDSLREEIIRACLEGTIVNLQQVMADQLSTSPTSVSFAREEPSSSLRASPIPAPALSPVSRHTIFGCSPDEEASSAVDRRFRCMG